MVGSWGSRDWGLAGVSVAAVLLVVDLFSCGAGVACSFGGLLVVGPSISLCGWVAVCVFILGGSLGFSWVMGYGHLPLGT